MGRFVIVAYRPKPGQGQRLDSLVARHQQILRAEGLVTERSASVMRAANGEVVEVFEWRSAEAIQQAHSNPAVQALWQDFDSACDYAPLASLAEAGQVFAEFESMP